MQTEVLQREIERFDSELPIAKAWTPPASWYTAPEFFELEKRSVFRRGWQPVARVAELAQPGSYQSGCYAGEPWVVVRGEDGEIRAFSNVCSHKGREVVTGDGVDNKLVCGYHGWAYDHEGVLRSAPRMGGVEDFDRSEMSLKPLRVEVWGFWVFISWDESAPALVSGLTELDTRLTTSRWHDLHFVDTRTWTIECNWKVYMDNYLDGGYHIPHMHPTLDAQLEMGNYQTELFAQYSIQSSPPSESTDERIAYDAGDRIGDEAIYAWLYPTFMINRYGPCLDTNWLVPLGPDRCRVHYEFYFAETEGAEAEAFIAESIAQSDVTQREDIEICESVQVGLHSAAYDRGRYAPRVEIGEHHFHRLLAADYRRAFS